MFLVFTWISLSMVLNMICQNYYMDFFKQLHGFVGIDKGIFLSFISKKHLYQLPYYAFVFDFTFYLIHYIYRHKFWEKQRKRKKNVTWFCQNWYMGFSELLYCALKVALWICLSCYMDLSNFFYVFIALFQTKQSWSLNKISKLVEASILWVLN